MIVEAIALGTITLSYKQPQPPVEVSFQVPHIEQLEAIKPVEQAELPPIALKPVTTAVHSSEGNLYEYRSCTWWVKNWKPEVPNTWGNADNWGIQAAAEGWTVSMVPLPGAIAWSSRGTYGHVALVLDVTGDTVTIQEGNYDWNGSVRTTSVSITSYQYIY